ncbi:flagellar basal body rod protein FlgB [Calidifontimicrobium sp. SYSU G02091]|uniref:flagellar basal body rod protein FlgB n=1 Tax=Calidifontimicrobium sp. SYSU G02091 TaxID=2926421 RepID=UPI001F536F70|nr:flagellar basal body rod protein FlgB [Calidifontimicrobium sp. SYSU G02091]MCI1193008.1 flagellar basal body rod protein FlgB [Calidifontimicrobium sp. SYSU G02091]
MLPRLGQVLDFQSQALLLRAERQRLIASNIANADTPGYQAREMDFAQALREATAGVAPAGTVARTAPGHIAPAASLGGERHLRWAAASQTSLDGNTVDMDRERASFADNAVKYEAALRFINGSVRTMLDAIKGQSQ